MNRAARRRMMKNYRHSGMSKQMAKDVVNANFMGDKFREGSKCRFNYELIIRIPEFNQQQDEFKNWIKEHKDDVLTVDKTRYDGTEVTFVEDANEKQFWHKSVTLIPVAFAQVKLNDGTQKDIVLEDVTDVNDVNSGSLIDRLNAELNKEEH